MRPLALFAALLPRSGGRSLYSTGTALRTGHLAVGPTHKLYFEVHGKADGAPALFLHGGPGAGCAVRHAGFFDPKHYQIVLFDQRGCGRSTPKGCLEANDTPSLVADIEALRTMLGFERCWGTTLALAYAQAYPECVGAMVLRAVCLMRQREIRWLFGSRGGAARLNPDGWQRFASYDGAPAAMAGDGGDGDGSGGGEEAPTDEEDEELALRRYAGVLGAAAAEPAAASAAARQWMSWEMAITSLGAALAACPTPAASAPEVDAAVAAAAAAASTAAASAAAASPSPPAAAAVAGGGCWAWLPAQREWRLCDAASGRPGAVVLDAAAVGESLCDGFQPRVAAAVQQRRSSAAGAAAAAAGVAAVATGGAAMAAGAAAGRVADKARTALLKRNESAAAGGGATGGVATASGATAGGDATGGSATAGGVATGGSGVTAGGGATAGAAAGGGAAATSGGGAWVPAQAMLTSHYSVHYGFLGDAELLQGVDKIRHIPCVAVQGANDVICPPATAYELHRAWPEMELRIAPAAGHSMYSAGLQTEVLHATDAFRDREGRTGSLQCTELALTDGSHTFRYPPDRGSKGNAQFIGSPFIASPLQPATLASASEATRCALGR